MKQKIFSLLVLVMTAVTASAIEVPTYSLNKAQGADAHGTIQFYVVESDNLVEVSSAADGQTVTMIITPNTGYVVNVVSGEWDAVTAAARGQHRSSSEDIAMEDVITLNHVSTDANGIATYTFEMIRAKATISCSYKKLLSNTEITVEDIADLTYTGSDIEPTITVKDGTTTLTLWNDQTQQGDYTVSYSNNVNAASATAQSAPTVTITAVETSEKYAGSTTKTFTIKPKPITPTVTVSGITHYNCAAQTPTVSVKDGDSEIPTRNYTVTYQRQTGNSFDNVTEIKDPGTYRVVVTAAQGGNYSFDAVTTETFKVEKVVLTVSADDTSATYGSAAPVFTATITGFVDGENVSALGGTLRFACSYTVGASAGSMFTITPSGLTSDKYAIKFVNGMLNVEKAPASASFSVRSVTKNCDDEPFSNVLTSTMTGTASYRSSNTAVATVDDNGLVTIHSAGKINIIGSLYVDDNHEVASDYYSLEVKPKEIMSGDGIQISWDGNNYSVTIDEDAAPGAVIPEEICDALLTYERMLDVSSKTAVSVNGKSSYLCTVCLPFTPYFNAKFYTLTGYSDGTLQFTEITGQAQAFTPYLVSLGHNVAVKNKKTVIIGFNGSVSEEDIAKFDGQPFTNKQDMSFCSNVLNGTVVDGYQLCGTLRGMTNADAAAAGAFILQTDGSWGAVKAGNEAVYIPPFRAYIVAASAQSARLTSSFGEGGATGIERIVTTDLDGTERWYDLNGRRIEKPTTKGVYIQNGKKTVIK